MRSILILLAAFVSGCASTVSVSNLKVIQNTQGFYTKSLYYTGSTRRYHHFDQFVLFDPGFWIPGVESDGYKGFKVLREELLLPSGFEFERKTYKGESDDRRRKIRIKDGPTFRVEKRKTAGERFAEKFPDGVAYREARVTQESDGTYILIVPATSSGNQTDNTTAGSADYNRGSP